MNIKKLVKLISCFIPNKKLRHNFRESYNKKILKKMIYSIEHGEAKRKLEEIQKEFPRVLSITETLNEVIEKKKSISRFGDGEFNLLVENKKAQNIFQTKNKKLKKKLLEILKTENKDILVCISPLKTQKKKKIELDKEPYFMERYWLYRWSELEKFFNKKISYGNSFISRINLFEEVPLKRIKKIWENKEVVFVYSKNGRFDIDERLFDNVKNYKEIFIPAINAYDI